MEARLVIVNILLICFIVNTNCENLNTNNGDIRSYMTSSSSSQSLSSGNGFSVSSTESSVNGRCVARITIYGNGIYKVIDYSCPSKPLSVINLDKKLLVADEFYSEHHGELIRVRAGHCEREVFRHHRETNRYTSTITTMSTEDCDKIKSRIVVLKQTQRRWDEWYKKRQQEAQHQLLQVQNNLASLQQQFFTSIFGTDVFNRG